MVVSSSLTWTSVFADSSICLVAYSDRARSQPGNTHGGAGTGGGAGDDARSLMIRSVRGGDTEVEIYRLGDKDTQVLSVVDNK